MELTQSILDSLNVEQAKEENRKNLDEIGGIESLAKLIGLNLETGLTKSQVLSQRSKFGDNVFPESPMESYFALLFNALTDSTLMILMAAASVSLVIGILTHPDNGWIEGAAIFIAIFLVSNISAGNDYSKQLQFKALEAATSNDERCSVLRDGAIERVNPRDLVVGDIVVLQAGDLIPADSIIVDHNVVKANESSLTGEPDDVKKSKDGDCFVISSCLITEGEECRALVIGIGTHSQWGKIKANLVTESVNTPLQDKLEDMTKTIGYIGMFMALATFIALVVRIFVNHHEIVEGFVDAFIVAVTIVVVAIPEGLPLAVTISLAYSTKKMYQDQCFIRVLAACETMGNATNICSDKTGTLTENRMTVVEGWFADSTYTQDEFATVNISENIKKILVEQISLNRTAYLIYKDQEGRTLDRPAVIGNKTEGALIMMIRSWGFDYDKVKSSVFNDMTDRIFAFNSEKKRATAVVHRADGSVRLYCKGASEWILKDCTMFLDAKGDAIPMTAQKRANLDEIINGMANRALRTLCLAHKDFSRSSDMPANWMENPPDNSALCLDCIVGIIDPLRSDVKEAVRIAQEAGVTVRMITGDNIATASAIARQCGILTASGMAVEGPSFRKMSPKDVDKILPNLQVMARSSPDDKYLLVTRLNGHGVPAGKEEWEEKFKDRPELTWDKDRDLVLPGYREEWEESRPDGGDVVGVTGDGTNDAPALKAADVGLAMGITGTKVAQGASDIVILDDKFSSIVRAITWGRAVYDAIRKFLQFQLTVNVTALTIVFIGAVVGFGEPLNAVQLLWVNLVMDTMGALALGTEPPTPELLQRKPYRRTASLISRPMWRNILCQATFQVALLLFLLFYGPTLFGVPSGIACKRFKVDSASTRLWDPYTKLQTTDTTLGTISCNTFKQYCSGEGTRCLLEEHTFNSNNPTVGGTIRVALDDLDEFTDKCLECTKNDYTHGAIIFNAFIFCQVFNEYNSRNLFDEWNMFKNVWKNYVFIMVSIFTLGAQIFLIELGGEFVKTEPLNLNQWLITIGLAAISLPVSVLQRLIPVVEDPKSFFVKHEVDDQIVPRKDSPDAQAMVNLTGIEQA